MSAQAGIWVNELPMEVMVTDRDGIILEMNPIAEDLFAEDGGSGLLGTNVLDCHPAASRRKLESMMQEGRANAYFNTEAGEKRFFFQAPWFLENNYSGFVELSFPVPEEISHFIRG